jgi:O-antigen ligase
MLIAADLFTDLKSAKRLLVVGLFSFVLVILDSFVQNVYGRDLILGYPIQLANERIRLTGPYQSYGLLAAHGIALIPVLFGLFIRSGAQIKKAGWGLLLLAVFYVLYQTQSRGAWLAVSCSFLVYGFLTRNKWFLITALAASLIVGFALPKRFLFHLDTFNQEQSMVERQLLWTRAISVIEARPWFGCGINTFTKNYPKYAQGKEWDLMKQEAMSGEYAHFGEKEAWRIPGHPDQIPGHYAHNGYLQIAAETGLISLILFLSIIGFSFRSGFQALRKVAKDKKPIMAGLICGLIALLLQAFVDTTLHNLQSAVLIWLFLGLLIVMNNVRINQ